MLLLSQIKATFLAAFIAIIATTGLAGCAATDTPTFAIDDATSNHPATKQFINFAAQAKTAESFTNLSELFYTTQTQQKMQTLLGWQGFVYSAPYKALKNGHCEIIRLKPIGRRMHLRVYMIEEQGRWYLDKSGYVSTSLNEASSGYNRAGLKFKADIE
jgi:hypothetical protein